MIAMSLDSGAVQPVSPLKPMSIRLKSGASSTVRDAMQTEIRYHGRLFARPFIDGRWILE